MDAICLEDIIKFYQNQTGLVDKVWWYFYSVTIAVLSLIVLGKERIKIKETEAKIIVAGYTMFYLGSAVSLWNAQNVLLSFVNHARKIDHSIVLSAFSPYWVIFFQGVIAIGVIAIILYMYRKQPNSTNNNEEHNA